MEPNAVGKGPKPDIPARANGRFTSPRTFLSGASRRRSFLPRPGSKDGPVTSPDANTVSPDNANTKIPRPSSQRTSQPSRFSMFDAWKIAVDAEELEAAQGSPSPAPRLLRTRRDSRLKNSPKSGSDTPSDLQQRRRLLTGHSDPALDGMAGSLEGSPNHSLRRQASDGSFEEKLRRHAAAEGEHLGDSPKRNSGSFRSFLSAAGKDLVRKTSRGSLDGGGSPTQAPKAKSGSPSWLSRRRSSRKSELSNSMTEHEGTNSEQGDKLADSGHLQSGRVTPPPPEPAGVPHDRQTPANKSFAWDADADFTAGDLQISDSPPVAIGRTNTKIDEIKALEAQFGSMLSDSPKIQPKNTKIDEIKTLETQQFSDEPPRSQGANGASQDDVVENADRVLPTVQTRRPSTKGDAIVTREIESLSRRALTTTRLDELRERGASDRSRSASPELTRPVSREPRRSLSPADVGGRKFSQDMALPVQEGATRPSDPAGNAPIITTTSKTDEHAQAQVPATKNTQEPTDEAAPGRRGRRTRSDAQDILRQLSRGKSTTPPPEPPASKEQVGFNPRGREGREAIRQRRLDAIKGDARLSVGFAGLPRDSSVDSGSDKRSTFAHSDSDPIERIEGEMQLFAPLDNQSERGSLRAPSPDSDDDLLNETPRPTKPDPLMMPTPRVTGSYVDTPATVKTEKLEVGPLIHPAGAESNTTDPTQELATSVIAATEEGPSYRGRKQNGSVQRTRPSSTVSARDGKPAPRSTSVSTRQRARSLPRRRSTSLTNSARPPTVKEDLMEIQRSSNVEDSTLDDFADLLDAHQRGRPTSVAHGVKLEESDDDLLGTFDRMNRSLQTGLLGIQTAKRGIERLENEVSHVDSKRLSHHHDINVSLVCPACHGHASEGKGTVTYLQLPIPRLWNRQRGFKFTLLGLVVFLLSLWYIAESTMCFYFCKPQYCYPGQPCDWSLDDPHWGYAIPVKLDQWTTGGRGRAWVDRVRPDVADWIADMWDVATGTDITQVDTSHYSWEEKRQYRRRLAKKGLTASSLSESPEDTAKYAAWRAARLAKERAEAAREMGYDTNDEDESIDADERI
ncbi:hypothetical protein V8F20_006551 [Naviculisporaceae sp. PSN 640]